MTAVNLLLIVVGLFFVARTIYEALAGGLRNVPGPLLSKFTNVLRLHNVYKGHTGRNIAKLHQKYGSTVRIGPNVVSVADPTAVDSIYGLKSNFVKGDAIRSHQALADGAIVPSLFTLQDKKQHAALKRPVANAYSLSTLKGFEPLVDDTIKHFVTRLAEEFIHGNNANRACDIDNWLQYFSYDVICQLTLSRRMGFLDNCGEANRIFSALDKEVYYRSVASTMPWVDTVFRKNRVVQYLFNTATSPFIARARGMIVERLTNPPPSGTISMRRDFVDRFLEARELHPEIVTDAAMAAYVSGNMAAGSDTIAIALRSIIYYALKDKRVLAKLHCELDSHNLTYPVSLSQAQGLSYTHAVIREALRIHPVGAGLMERVVPTEGLNLANGTILPPGTTVGMSGWALHFDRDVFGEDANLFRPERWLRDDGESEPDFNKRLHCMGAADLTFSKGSRSCIGKNIVDLELQKVVPTLFNMFEMELVNPHRDWHVVERFFTRQSQMDVRLRWRRDPQDMKRMWQLPGGEQ